MLNSSPSRPIITGVVGSDCHMVGNALVANALEEAGFKVVRLGAMVPPQDFIEVAIETNAAAVVVSSIYGQGAFDCEGFRDRCVEAGIPDIVLYLGGNLNITTEDWADTEKRFLAMGFNRVYSATAPMSQAVADLRKDLGLEDLKATGETAGHSFNIAIDRGKGLAMGNVSSRRFDEEAFQEERQHLLALWPTGKDIDLHDAADYLKSLPPMKIFTKKLAEAKKKGEILIMPMLGKATIEETLEDALFVEAAGADVEFIISDAFTRKLQFEKAEAGIAESIRQGKSVLNGFPWVNHGLKRNREMITQLRNPVHCNMANDEDPRLFCEMAFASGATAGISHDLRDLITHAKDYPLAQRIHNNQYQARLVSWYEERGIRMDLSLIGTISIFTPPSMGVAIIALDAMCASAQGAKHLSFCWDTYGAVMQNVAGIRAMMATARKYLTRLGYSDVEIKASAYPVQAEWPKDRDRMAAVSSLFCTIGAMAGVDWMWTKSLDEALVTPRKEGIAAAVKINRQLVDLLKRQRYPLSAELQEEQRMIETEASLIIDKVLELGDGDSVRGTIKAVELGVLDAPFSPYVYLKSKVEVVHDAQMGRRYLAFGNLPFTEEVKAYHREKIAERERADERKADLNMVVDDMRAYARELVPV